MDLCWAAVRGIWWTHLVHPLSSATLVYKIDAWRLRRSVGEKRGSAEKERACEWEIGCIWGFGFVSDYTLFCILPFWISEISLYCCTVNIGKLPNYVNLVFLLSVCLFFIKHYITSVPLVLSVWKICDLLHNNFHLSGSHINMIILYRKYD